MRDTLTDKHAAAGDRHEPSLRRRPRRKFAVRADYFTTRHPSGRVTVHRAAVYMTVQQGEPFWVPRGLPFTKFESRRAAELAIARFGLGWEVRVEEIPPEPAVGRGTGTSENSQFRALQ